MRKAEKEIVSGICNEFFDTIKEFARNKWALVKFNPTLKCDWSPKRARSWGGSGILGNYISLAMQVEYNHAITEKQNQEYASYSNDPVIGDFNSDDPIIILKALLCHELAHCLTAHLGVCDNHGPNWQSYYKILREIFINPLAAANAAANFAWNAIASYS